MPLNFFYTTVQKSQKWPKTQIRRGGPALRQAWTDQKRDIWRRYISHFLHQSVPFTSEICRSKFQRCSSIGSGRKGRGKNDRFDPLGGAVPGCCTWQGIATRAKQQEKVGLPSRMSSSWTWLYDLGSLTSKQNDAACSSCCWWSITWPGPAGPCRRTIADVGEPSKKHQLFIFGVPCVRFLSNDEDWDSDSRRRSSTQEAACAKQPFSHHGTSGPQKSQNSFDQSWSWADAVIVDPQSYTVAESKRCQFSHYLIFSLFRLIFMPNHIY